MESNDANVAFGSRFENVELVQAAIDEAIAARGADEDARHWVGLAVREAVANAIKHGNQQDPEKRVEVAVKIADDEVEIAVADEGKGFDPGDVRDPLAPRRTCFAPTAAESSTCGVSWTRCRTARRRTAAPWSGCASDSRRNAPTARNDRREAT